MNQHIVVIALGNDILGDDGAAFAVVRELSEKFAGFADFEFISGGGLELLDYLEGRKKALIIDTISGDNVFPGSIMEFDKNDFPKIVGSSPHYMGLPEVLKLAESLEIVFPEEIKILAVGIKNLNIVTEILSNDIIKVLPALTAKAEKIITGWIKQEVS